MPSSKNNVTDCYKAMLLLWISFMFHVCHAVLSVHCSLLVTCCEKAYLLALLYVMFSSRFLSLTHVVSWDMCGI